MSKKIIAVLAVVVVAIVAVAAVFMLTGNDEKKDTYYVFVDGTGTVDGWYTGEGTTVIDGVKNAFDNGKVKYDISDKGWIVSIDGKESDTKNQIGYGIFEYTSASVESPYMGYFVTGPVITDCVGNILYITYSEYDFDGKFGNNVYKVCPTDTPNGNKLKNGGPFTDKDYKPLEYKSPFYLYLAGFDGKTNGWYKCEGKDMLSA
ncbi:MAG: hypothetical protein MJZ68_05020, partial [archaeon]|nr:hypothetical protein [archaeon]